MTPGDKRPFWRVFGQSVQGTVHTRARLPNQDAVMWWPRRGGGPAVALAVADGHGGAAYFRSHIGARRAVHEAIRILWGLGQQQEQSPDLSALRHECEEWLPKLLVREWSDWVKKHHHRKPFLETEWKALAQRVNAREYDRAWEKTRDNPALAYGATLIAALITERFIVYLQLGDGDILTVAQDGEVTRPPLPADHRLIANDTTSLCSPAAWKDCRLHFQPLVAAAPALVLLATDGYTNSFAGDDGFLAVGSDLLATLRADGPDTVRQRLGEWLYQTSQSGSGDDITLALAFQQSAVSPKW